MSFAEKWMKLEIIILSEISQAQKARYCMFLLICGTRSIVIIVVMGHEYKWGLVGRRPVGGGREKAKATEE
jgi:hypothetical protein